MRPLVLDFDGSVGSLAEADVIPLSDRQEAIRFGCSLRALRALEPALAPALARRPRIVFMGSGDYHHVSFLLIDRLRALAMRVRVIVFDNHPDNMRYPFGIHCGSWVRHVARLPFVERVYVVGIASTDVESGHLWENYLAPLYRGKLVYFCVNRDLRGLERIGIRHCRSFASVGDMLNALARALAESSAPLYLSIDKDVLAPAAVQTNWDQGVMRAEELAAGVRLLRERVIAADVVGDVSAYRYRSRLKRFLSRRDRQPAIPPASLGQWQIQHQRLNRELVALLS